MSASIAAFIASRLVRDAISSMDWLASQSATDRSVIIEISLLLRDRATFASSAAAARMSKSPERRSIDLWTLEMVPAISSMLKRPASRWKLGCR